MSSYVLPAQLIGLVNMCSQSAKLFMAASQQG